MSRLKIILLIAASFSLLLGCDSSDDAPQHPAQTPTPTSVPWQRAQELIQVQNAPSIQLVGRLDGAQAAVIDLKFSPANTYLAGISTGDSQVRVWNLSSGRSSVSLSNIKASAVFFGPENDTIITINQDKQIQEWSLFEAQQLLRTFPAQNGQVGPSTQSSDLQKIAVGGEFGEIYLFQLSPLRENGVINAHPIIAIQWLLYTPDGEKLISVASGGTIKIWDADTRQLIHDFGRFDQAPVQVAMAPDGKTFAFSTVKTIQLWSLENYNLLGAIPITDNAASNYLGYSPDGSMLIGYGANDFISIWDVGSGTLMVGLPGHTQDVAGAIFSTDMTLLLTGIRTGGAFLWDLSHLAEGADATGQIQIPQSQIGPRNMEVYRLAWSSDQKWIAISDLFGRVNILAIP